jgi:transitional endoplasmic reticulum ATPase
VVGGVRGNDTTTEGTMDRLLSTILVELDGIDDDMRGEAAGIAVIGTTHNVEWIDPALRRPGRLGRVTRLEPRD